MVLLTSEHPDTHSRKFDGVDVHCVWGARPEVYYPAEWWRGSVLKARDLLSRSRYSVIHSHGGSGLHIMRQGLDCRHRVPMLATMHGNTLGLIRGTLRSRVCLRHPGAASRALASAGRRLVDHTRLGLHRVYRRRYLITPSKAEVQKLLMTLRIPRDRLYLVRHGVDTTRFRPPTRSHLESRRSERRVFGGGPILLMLGRVIREKGMHLGVQALPSILRRFPTTTLLVVGDGKDVTEVCSIAAKLKVERSVRFVGPVPHETTPRYFALADVFLFPTLHDEAFGLAAAQAMACGCPVVASRVGAVPEVVGSAGEGGLLVEPGDVRGLACAVLALLESPRRRNEIAKSARLRVLQRFSLDRMVSETVSVYTDILRRESERSQGGVTDGGKEPGSARFGGLGPR